MQVLLVRNSEARTVLRYAPDKAISSSPAAMSKIDRMPSPDHILIANDDTVVTMVYSPITAIV